MEGINKKKGWENVMGEGERKGWNITTEYGRKQTWQKEQEEKMAEQGRKRD